jgi:hypothetical protein
MSSIHLPATVSVFATTGFIRAASVGFAGRRGVAVAGRVSITIIIATTIVTARLATVPLFTATTTTGGVAINATTVAVVVTVFTTRIVAVFAAAFAASFAATFAATTIVTTITVGVITTITVVVTTTTAAAATPAATVRSASVIITVTTAAAATRSTEVTLGRSKVFARSRSSGAATTSLLNAQSTALDNLALQALLGSISLLGSDHLDEAEATRFLGVRVQHDRAVLDIAVLLEQTGDIGLGQTRVDTGDEKVRAGVDGTFFIIVGLPGIDGSTVIGTPVGRTAASTIAPRLIARRSTAVASEARLVVVATVLVIVFSRHYVDFGMEDETKKVGR